MPTNQKISLFVIAHNEETLIRKCLESIEKQSKKPDEVFLIAHNCKDNTEEIAKEFKWLTVVHYDGPRGTAYARAKGFEMTTGDIILSTDGDSVLPKTWVASLTKPFLNENVVGVGAPVIYTGNIIIVIGSFFHQILLWYRNTIRNDADFWGPSFAVRASAFKKVGGFTELFELKPKVGLTYWLEDNFLANRISFFGKVVFLPLPFVYAVARPKTKFEMKERFIADNLDRKIFREKIKR